MRGELRNDAIMPAVERGESLLECKTGNLDIDCSVAGEAPFITLTDKEGRQLSWGIEGAMSILPDAEEIQDAASANVRQLREKALSRLHGEVVYGGIFVASICAANWIAALRTS